MNTKFTTAKWFGLAALAALSTVGTLHADTTYNVDINTAALGSATDGPFYLDFQLAPGNGTLTNQAYVRNVLLSGGGSTGAATDFSFGGSTSGDLSGGFTLNNNGGFAEIFQGFDATMTDIKFTVQLTQNSTGTTPDGFNIAVLDGNTFQIPTDNADGLSLASFALGNSINDPATTFTTGKTIGTDAPGVTISVIATPEPSSWALGAIAIGAFLFVRRMVQRGSKSSCNA